MQSIIAPVGAVQSQMQILTQQQLGIRRNLDRLMGSHAEIGTVGTVKVYQEYAAVGLHVDHDMLLRDRGQSGLHDLRAISCLLAGAQHPHLAAPDKQPIPDREVLL
jgi:hypothetical protein